MSPIPFWQFWFLSIHPHCPSEIYLAYAIFVNPILVYDIHTVFQSYEQNNLIVEFFVSQTKLLRKLKLIIFLGEGWWIENSGLMELSSLYCGCLANKFCLHYVFSQCLRWCNCSLMLLQGVIFTWNGNRTSDQKTWCWNMKFEYNPEYWYKTYWSSLLISYINFNVDKS